jgi:KipI family sensor histidine kinase inhibitor
VTPATVRHRIVEYGDAALLVQMQGGHPEQRWTAACVLADVVTSAPPPGLTDIVATFEDVFVEFDPLVTDHARMSAAIGAAESSAPAPRTAREHRIPTVYGGDHGPDLDDVAAELRMSPDELVRAHSAAPWTVRFRGAPAGSPMTDGPTLPAPVDRLREPRIRVPPGSVALSGAQCVIYSVPSPGGWRLIGRTPLGLIHPDRDPIVAYRPGDRLRFVPIPASAWEGETASLLLDPGPRTPHPGEGRVDA